MNTGSTGANRGQVLQHHTANDVVLQDLTLVDPVTSRLQGLAVVCEDFQDPHNAGAVMRTCEALGVLNVYIIEEHRPCMLSSSVTAGTDRWLRVHRYRRARAAMDALRAEGYRVYAATPEGGTVRLDQLPIDVPLALVFGNEQQGVSKVVLSQADGTFTIPMYGFVPSLNVSAAAAIAVHHCAHQRRQALGRIGDLSADEIETLRAEYAQRRGGTR